ncbi:transposase [Nocardia macrotermitis]|uniref:Transposase n=1 Tax=Nocardia macrotermitis TaxID=2585198 RepID=A0A7K0D6N1_9NOCA|nr:transposase [Nocardia macrotermitis]MQY21403.1 hypothetical protein [Nocardia macrotermitis]
MGSTRRSFTQEYRAQAVAFVLEERRPVAEVARNIGVHEMTLRKWVRTAKESGAGDDPGGGELTGSERAELERLRARDKELTAENAELKMQVAFAKKVATWFAKDQR